MTEDEAEAEIRDLKERVMDLENEREAIKNLPGAVAELHGAVETLKSLVIGKLDGITDRVTPGRWDTLLKFSQFVIVPVIVAAITGYFLYKASIPNGVHK